MSQRVRSSSEVDDEVNLRAFLRHMHNLHAQQPPTIPENTVVNGDEVGAVTSSQTEPTVDHDVNGTNGINGIVADPEQELQTFQSITPEQQSSIVDGDEADRDATASRDSSPYQPGLRAPPSSPHIEPTELDEMTSERSDGPSERNFGNHEQNSPESPVQRESRAHLSTPSTSASPSPTMGVSGITGLIQDQFRSVMAAKATHFDLGQSIHAPRVRSMGSPRTSVSNVTRRARNATYPRMSITIAESSRRSLSPRPFRSAEQEWHPQTPLSPISEKSSTQAQSCIPSAEMMPYVPPHLRREDVAVKPHTVEDRDKAVGDSSVGEVTAEAEDAKLPPHLRLFGSPAKRKAIKVEEVPDSNEVAEVATEVNMQTRNYDASADPSEQSEGTPKESPTNASFTHTFKLDARAPKFSPATTIKTEPVNVAPAVTMTIGASRVPPHMETVPSDSSRLPVTVPEIKVETSLNVGEEALPIISRVTERGELQPDPDSEDSWFEAPVAITANDQKENLQDRVYFDSWPKSDIRSAPAARVRKVIISNLPPGSLPSFVASLVYGGALESIVVGSSSAWVLFLNADDCVKYYTKTYNGVVYRSIEGKDMVAFVQLAKDVDVVGGLLQNYIDGNVTRCVRAIGVAADIGLTWLMRVAERNGRKLEGLEDSINAAGSRSITFRFCKIQNAVTFKAVLARDEEWEHCNIQYVPDPCAVATDVHFEE